MTLHRLAFLTFASALAIVANLGMSAGLQGATITGINYLAPDDDGFFQDPAGTLYGSTIENFSNGLAASASSRAVQGGRDSAQSFTVDATTFPFGIDVSGFAINYRLAPASTALTFGVGLFSIDSIGGSLPATSAISDFVVFSATDSLKFETSIAEGTATFTFDEAVHLDPGAYAWRFLIVGSGSATLFEWARSGGSNDAYPLGNKYEGNADTASQSAPASDDFYFGLIGVASVPEPTGCSLLVIGSLAMCSCARKWGRKAP